MRKLIVALLLAPAAAFAGGYAIPNENARSLGLAQADVAAQTGPEAAYQNAAALAGQEGLGVTANLEMIYNRTTWSDPTLGTASLKPHANFPPMLAVAYGGKIGSGDMAYGLGVAFLVPAGGSLFWPTGWPGAGRIQSVDQKVYLTQFSGGFQPIPGIKVGASFLYYRITESLVQQLDFIDTTGQASLGLGGNAYSFGLSGQFDVPNIPLAFGIDYRHHAAAVISGNAHFDNVPPSFASQLQDQGASEHITVPNQLFVGAAYDIALPAKSDLKLMATFTLERWIEYGSDTYVGDKGLVITVPRDCHNTQIYRIAGEYSHLPFLPPLTLRLGFERSISPQSSDLLSPTLTDADSTVITVGAGFNFTPGLRFDVGYQYAFFDTVTATGPEAFPGSYDTHVHLLSAGLTWQPGKL
jgi:long-subunit fatty acid transport protein